MADAHSATPNSSCGTVSTESQNATATVPMQIDNPSIAAGQNDSDATKIVSSSPGV